jgi:hypothetical protein
MGCATASGAAHLFDQVRDLGHVARKNTKWLEHVLHGKITGSANGPPAASFAIDAAQIPTIS